MYESQRFIGRVHGTTGFHVDPNIGNQALDWEQITAAWNHLVATNSLFAQYQDVVLAVPPVQEHIRLGHLLQHQPTLFAQTFITGAEQVDPHGADAENAIENLLIGVDNNSNLVSYSNPDLLGLCFPYLYTVDRGFFRLNRDYPDNNDNEAYEFQRQLDQMDNEDEPDMEEDMDEEEEGDYGSGSDGDGGSNDDDGGGDDVRDGDGHGYEVGEGDECFLSRQDRWIRFR